MKKWNNNCFAFYMGLKNKIVAGEIYFLTMTVVDWVDVFTRPDYKEIVVESLNYCARHKGLIMHGCL